MNHRFNARGLRRPPQGALLVTGAGIAALLLTTSPVLAAPTPHECATASEDASSLQKQEKLIGAKDRFLVCADAACPAEIREECSHRLTEIAAAMPSVVFDVKDAAGNDVSAARVAMDGAPLVDHLGAAAVTIDPGEHVFRFDSADPSQSVEKRFVIRDGEKNRHLAIVLGGAGAPAAPAAVVTGFASPSGPEPASSSWGGQKTAALVAGGVGVVGLGLGALFGALTYREWNSAKTECDTNCAPVPPPRTTGARRPRQRPSRTRRSSRAGF